MQSSKEIINKSSPNNGADRKPNPEILSNITPHNLDAETRASSSSGSIPSPVVKRKNSKTHYYKQKPGSPNFRRVDLKEYLSDTDSLSQTTSIPCFQKKEYTEKALLKRNLVKNLDPIKPDPKWIEGCPPDVSWSVVTFLEDMINSSFSPYTEGFELERFEAKLKEFVMISADGYRFEYLDSISRILDWFSDYCDIPIMDKYFSMLLTNAEKPIFLKTKTDILAKHETLQNYFTVLGCLMITANDENKFNILYNVFMWQLNTPDKLRGPQTIRKLDIIFAATPILVHTVTKMITFSSSNRFLSYIELALILACHSYETCVQLLEGNILDSILSRYNPYFPHNELSDWDIKPELIPKLVQMTQLGDSTTHSNIVLSVLLILSKSAQEYLRKNPNAQLPLPSTDAIKHFAWAFRYECCMYERRHERISMCVVISALLHCYGRRLVSLPSCLMADVISLSILTEVPVTRGWIRDVPFNKSARDVKFKIKLLYLSLNFLKTFPENAFMVEHRYWLMGLMQLVDPELSSLRTNWSPSLFQELHKTTLQTLTCSIDLIPPRVIQEYALIRRLLWYVEWYSICPYEICILYWTLRVLYAATYKRNTEERKNAVIQLFDSHGFVLLADLCHKMLDDKFPITEKVQVILALNLRMLTMSVACLKTYNFQNYSKEAWIDFIAKLGFKMLNFTLYTLDRGYKLCDSFIICVMNYIWQTIVWDENYRKIFIATSGVYKLLDLIAISSSSVQCITLAVLCDLIRGSNSVPQLITWRAKLQVDEHNQVKHGSTIIPLLASIYRDDCRENCVKLDENGVIQDLDNPVMSKSIRNLLKKQYPIDIISRSRPISYTACDFAGSRASKVYVIIHLLYEDLSEKVELADEKYNLYKNVEISTKDEITLILCLHHFTAKLQESWTESKCRMDELLPEDKTTFEEFLHLGTGWANQIKKYQQGVLRRDRRKHIVEEDTLYSFLGRARLCVALDSLREIRCMARTADRTILTHCLIQDVVLAHHRRSAYCHEMDTSIFPTYQPKLDNQNLIGQNFKTQNIKSYEIPKTKQQVSKVFLFR